MDYLDIDSWPRKAAFEFFRAFDKPYFNVCLRLDVAALKATVAALGVGTFTLAYHYLALRLANEHEPFRYRLQGGRVRIHDVVHGGATVLRDDDSFGFAELPYHRDYARFADDGAAAMARARLLHAPFEPRLDAAGVIHTTTLPLIPFTSFSHARNWGREDSVPKLAFGRAERDGSRLWLPFSVEVHHALMDGVHVGRYVRDFEGALREPLAWLA
jgi:chloramphenicol O-acetyltransferase type A